MFKYWGCPRYVIKHTIFFYFVSFPSPLLRFYSLQHFTSARQCQSKSIVQPPLQKILNINTKNITLQRTLRKGVTKVGQSSAVYCLKLHFDPSATAMVIHMVRERVSLARDPHCWLDFIKNIYEAFKAAFQVSLLI